MRSKSDIRPAGGGPRQVFLYSVIIILAARMSFSLSTRDFVISGGIIPLAVFLLMIDTFPFVPVLLFSAAGVLLTRMLDGFLAGEAVETLFASRFPEFIFYLVYGALLYLYYHFMKERLTRGVFFIPLLLPDYLANLTELALRSVSVAAPATQGSILAAAVIRTLLIWILATRLDPLSFTLLRREHIQRYERLLLLTSSLQSEELWMSKNAAQIESAMNDTYKLYTAMKEQDADPALTKSALRLATSVHEIKKEYLLVTRGLSEIVESDEREDGMFLWDIFQVLSDTFSRKLEAEGRRLILSVSINENLYVRKHYEVLSIFRNLIMNASEASDMPETRIEIADAPAPAGFVALSVTDHGKGIPAENLEEIFSPGFSTKINYKTGEISRGLGLSLVRDIAVNALHGGVSAGSGPSGTVFTVTMDRGELEETNEILPD